MLPGESESPKTVSIKPKQETGGISDERRSQFGVIDYRKCIPGNVSTPSLILSKTDELFGSAFGNLQKGYPANEFVGLPVAEDLMRAFDEQFQLMLGRGSSG